MRVSEQHRMLRFRATVVTAVRAGMRYAEAQLRLWLGHQVDCHRNRAETVHYPLQSIQSRDALPEALLRMAQNPFKIHLV
jgi:hypothetical protein